MDIKPFSARKLLLAFTATILITSIASAAHYKQHQLKGGLDVYLTVVPAEMIRGHPKEHIESQMHGGIPTEDQYHVIVTLFSNETKERIVDANVIANVISENYSGPVLKLERMILAGETSYGNYIVVPANDAFKVLLQIQVKGRDDVTNVSFRWAKT